MPEPIVRRTFLGFRAIDLGDGAIVLSDTPAIFLPEPEAEPVVQSPKFITELFLAVPVGGTYLIRRANGHTMLSCGLAAGQTFVWSAAPGFEIVLLPGEPFLEITGPGQLESGHARWTDGDYSYTTIFGPNGPPVTFMNGSPIPPEPPAPTLPVALTTTRAIQID